MDILDSQVYQVTPVFPVIQDFLVYQAIVVYLVIPAVQDTPVFLVILDSQVYLDILVYPDTLVFLQVLLH